MEAIAIPIVAQVHMLTIDAEGIADGKRLAICGANCGGYAAMMAAAET